MPMNILPTLALLALGTALHAVEPLTLPLWPAGPGPRVPTSPATQKMIDGYGKPSATHVTPVLDPTLTFYRAEKAGAPCVVVAPGGGYMFLSYSFEGTQVCEWLHSIGVAAVLLKYRTPTRDEAEAHTLPVQDARRAIAIAREHAAEWGIDAKRVGLLGFSAGGNILGHAAFDADPVRPDFGIMIYGGGFLDAADKTKFRKGFSVPADAPPMFFAVAHDDKSNPIEATRLYLEYKRLKRPAELHIYTHGGHGFGMRKDGHPINEWPARCAEWLGSMGLLDAAK